MWEVEDNGFLPAQKPAYISRGCIHGVGQEVEILGEILPELIMDRTVREELVAVLRPLAKHIPSYLNDLKGDQQQLERFMMLLSYFASAYVYASNESPSNRLPEEIAVPFVSIAGLVRRPPILSYASCCLNNWVHSDLQKPIELGSIGILQKFVHPSIDGSTDEDWFVLVHVAVEARAAEAISAINRSHAHIESSDGSEVSKCLHQLCDSLKKINVTMKRISENCRPDYHFKFLRPYISDFQNVTYEGIYGEPQSFRGETILQSSVVSAIQTSLGILHKNSMRNYMPPAHRNYIDRLLEKPTLRSHVENDDTLKSLYNECIIQLSEFREHRISHIESYVHRKIDGPWKSKMQEEAEGYLL